MYDSLVSRCSEEFGNRSFDWPHPLLELRLCEFSACNRRRYFKDVFLNCRLKIIARCIAKTRVVLFEHANEAVELVDSPLVRLCRIGRKVGLLFVEQLLSPGHFTHGLSESCLNCLFLRFRRHLDSFLWSMVVTWIPYLGQ